MDMNDKVKWKYMRPVKMLILAMAGISIFTACGSFEKEIKEETEKKSPEAISITTKSEEQEQEGAEQEQRSLEDLAAQIQAEIAPIESAGGTASVYVEALSDGANTVLNSQQMQAASLIKLYIAGCVYEQEAQVRAQDTYDGEMDSLMNAMITVSDNDAANTLTRRLGNGDGSVGMAQVNRYCESHGYADTHMGRLLLAPNDVDDNYTSTADCGKFLREIQNGELQGAASILGYLKNQQRTTKIPAGVPAGVETANKTGELADVENDAAIIYGNPETYIICVMMSGLVDTYQARNVITEVSAITYRHLCAQ